MPRYSQKLGPAADFSLTDVFQILATPKISRHFDDGELLILLNARTENNTASDIFYVFQTLLDGNVLGSLDMDFESPPGITGSASRHYIRKISQGFHTLEVQAKGNLPASGFVVNGSVILTVIQLPQWDSDADIQS